MTTLTEDLHAGAFIVSEGNGKISREAITVASGQNLKAGAVLGQITLGAATAAHVAGGTGNSTFSAVTVDGAAIVGVYQGIFTAATKANLEDPNGVLLGVVALGTEFSAGGLTFTVTAGGTAHVSGDRFTITVAAGSGAYVAYDNSAENGSNIAAGILFDAVDASSDDAAGVAVVRLAEVAKDGLVWDSGQDTDDKAAAYTDLAALNIIARD
jgi:hypothetical protein